MADAQTTSLMNQQLRWCLRRKLISLGIDFTPVEEEELCQFLTHGKALQINHKEWCLLGNFIVKCSGFTYLLMLGVSNSQDMLQFLRMKINSI